LRSFFISFVKKIDGTLPIINKSKHPKKKRGRNTKNKKEGLKSKKTIEPSKKANHKGRKIKFSNPLLFARSISYQIRKGEVLLKWKDI
jgi:hypothetical protein